jgi:hypothetical protein
MTDLIAIFLCIGLLVSLRLGYEFVKRLFHQPNLMEQLGDIVSVEIKIGTGSISASQCVLRDMKRDETGRVTMSFEAYQRHY